MDEHNEYLLQVSGGVFEVLSEFFLKHRILPLICLYFRELRFDMATITNHGKKTLVRIFICCRICLLDLEFNLTLRVPITTVVDNKFCDSCLDFCLRFNLGSETSSKFAAVDIF